MDEDSSLQDVLTMFLEQECGFEVWVANDELEAFKLLDNYKFDVLLFNYWIETDLTRRVIELARLLGVRTYIMTTLLDHEEIKKELDVTGSFKKPFDVEEMIKKLH